MSTYTNSLKRNAIIVHGMPSKEEYENPQFPSPSNSHWLPWLQKQLIIRGVAAHSPEIPDAWNPDYPTWQREFERFDIGSATILVGHDCGAGFIVRWLSEHKNVNVGRVILVAPWMDPRRRETSDFFDFDWDDGLSKRTKGLTIFNSSSDHLDVHTTVSQLRRWHKRVDYQEFHGYGHFCSNDMKSDAFPELLETALGVFAGE